MSAVLNPGAAAAMPAAKPMRAEELRLSYPFEAIPALGEVFDITAQGSREKNAPRVRWLRMNLPFALDHINLWLLEDAIDGKACWSAIDCGVGLPPTRDAWEHIFANQFEGLPLGRVIITHAHPDHIGNAEWLCRRFGVMMTATSGEYFWGRIHKANLPGVDNDAQVAHFRRHGLSPAMCKEIDEGRKDYYGSLVPSVPEAFVRMRGGDALSIGGRAWTVHTGFGHSAEHASLYCAALNMVISGDMLLPRISTNVGVWPNEPQANPLKWFLDSLTLYETMPDDVLVLPSHGRLFRGARERVKQLRDHHRDRLTETFDACVKPCSAADIIPIMFHRELDAHQTTFAIGEALSHLHLLRDEGKLRGATGDDGIVRFVRSA